MVNIEDNTTPKFSILMPTYNRVDVIGYAIESVLYQTQKDFELLIVGDGCTDNTGEIVLKYAKQDPRIKWFDLPKAPGFGYANRNTVLKQAQGQYIAFAAHDDILFPDHLELLGDLLDNNIGIDIVVSRAVWVGLEGLIFPSPYNLDDPVTFDIFMNKENAIPASCFVHRRSVFSKIGYWDETLTNAADWDFWKRIINLKKSKNFMFFTTPTMFHFKAIWKDKVIQWPYRGGEIFEYLDEIGYQMPALLKLDLNRSKTQQEALWKTIKTDNIFLENFRTQARAFIDSFMQYHLPNSQKASLDLLIQIQTQKQIQEQLRHEVRLLEGSFFFRLRDKILKIFPKGSIQYQLVKRVINTVR